MNTLRKTISDLRLATGASEVSGWMNDACLYLVYGLVKWFQPTCIIQTGHLWGKSASVLLEALVGDEPLDPVQQMGDPKFADFIRGNTPPKAASPKLISVDPHPWVGGVKNWDSGVDLLKGRYGDHFEFINARSQDFFAGYNVQHERLMGVVDGDHSWEGCKSDIEALVKLGARMLVVDDTSWLPHLAPAKDLLPSWNCLSLPEWQGILVAYRPQDS